jgi:2'-hydroxybiphenyl-2-sulfinate desulfinase
VQRLVDAVVDAGRWAMDHGVQTTQLHAENLGVSEKAISLGFGSDFHRHLIPRLDENALAILERTQSFLLDRELIPHPVHLNHWAAPDFLNRSISRSIENTL